MANWADAINIEGLPEVMTSLALHDAEAIARTEAALHAGGDIVAAAAKANLSGHRWSGRLESKIEVRERGPLTVVVRSATPGGRPLEVGWSSTTGKQPPSGPRSRLVKWLGSKGVAEPRSVAFVVARSIGRRGYGFAPLHWMERAAEESSPGVLAAVEGAARIP